MSLDLALVLTRGAIFSLCLCWYILLPLPTAKVPS